MAHQTCVCVGQGVKWKSGEGMENGAGLALTMCSDCNLKLEDPQDGFPPSSLGLAFCLLQVLLKQQYNHRLFICILTSIQSD